MADACVWYSMRLKLAVKGKLLAGFYRRGSDEDFLVLAE